MLIEFKDRLARFGFAYLVEALHSHWIRVEVLDGPVAVDASQELVADMLALVTCFAARCPGSGDNNSAGRYGKRPRRRAWRLPAEKSIPATLAPQGPCP